MRHLGRSLFVPLALGLFLPACAGYYPTWHYAPNAEIHQLHIGDEGKDGAPAVEVTASVVGILRPDAARRLHARLDVLNRGPARATLDLATVLATPSGAPPLKPDTHGVIELAPGERRTAELYFPIPDVTALPNTSLLEIDLGWSVDVGGKVITSHATFRRTSYYDGPYYYDPWYAGYPYPYYWGPYYGPYYGPWGHYGFTYVHCH